MIIIYHNENHVIEVYDYQTNKLLDFNQNHSIQKVMFSIADKFNQIIGWCHIKLKNRVSLKELNLSLKNPLTMISFNVGTDFFIDESIGFVEDSPFINVNKEVKYPTWLMSSDVGFIHAVVLLKFKKLLHYKLSFSYFLNTVSKIGSKKGLLCYSVTSLIKNGKSISAMEVNNSFISKTEMFQFLKSNYKKRWQLIYLLNNLLYNHQFLFWSFLKSIFKRKIKCNPTFEDIDFNINSKELNPKIDVIIPTLGRANYLKNVLMDLSKQTILPSKVIIVEQNSLENSISGLDFLSENWPFQIDHTLIHKLGACNARNIALSKVTGDWVFFADDDIRLNDKIIEETFKSIQLYQAEAVTISCLQQKEIENEKNIIQHTTFGSGTSFVKTQKLKNLKFDLAYEFGYGEDADFGMQLRNSGIDILYLPIVQMIHLKAPVGGFRNTIRHDWQLEKIQPKPSPTIMVYKLKYATKNQLQGYKTILFVKYYFKQKILNPFKYYHLMIKKWNKSIFWANKLIEQS
ncbi:MAG: glycosyltransferase family 2 protein [Lutibacter sp.]